MNGRGSCPRISQQRPLQKQEGKLRRHQALQMNSQVLKNTDGLESVSTHSASFHINDDTVRESTQA